MILAIMINKGLAFKLFCRRHFSDKNDAGSRVNGLTNSAIEVCQSAFDQRRTSDERFRFDAFHAVVQSLRSGPQSVRKFPFGLQKV